MGRPTHLEVSADAITVTRGTATVVADGNVKGFYRLATGSQPGDYQFAGEHAVATYVTTAIADTPLGLNVLVTGSPVTVQGPGLG